MNILDIIRLGPKISTGTVYKVIFEPSAGEKEHSLHIIINGSILRHEHPDSLGIAEGYREWDLETRKPTDWKVVGLGMPEKSHEIPYKEGIRFVEGIKVSSDVEKHFI